MNICNVVNSSRLESPQFICCCTNLYMSWTKISRTKFDGLKEIICCRWWKASKNYQACQISKGNWCCVDSYSEVEGPFCKWLLFLQIQGIFYAIVSNCWSQETIYGHFCWHVWFNEWLKSVAFIFSLSKCYTRRSFPWKKFASWHQPYIIGDKGYPLLPWLMVPHKQNAIWHSMLQALYNR